MNRFLKVLATGTVLLTVACAPTIDNRGQYLTERQMNDIVVGETTKDDITTLLGSPSSTSTFSDATWYYIGTKTETLAFYKPEVIEQRVAAISFDDQGIVSNISLYSLDDSQKIKPVGRTTPTAGKELNAIQQIFSNIGRFGKAGQQGK